MGSVFFADRKHDCTCHTPVYQILPNGRMVHTPAPDSKEDWIEEFDAKFKEFSDERGWEGCDGTPEEIKDFIRSKKAAWREEWENQPMSLEHYATITESAVEAAKESFAQEVVEKLEGMKENEITEYELRARFVDALRAPQDYEKLIEATEELKIQQKNSTLTDAITAVQSLANKES